MQQAATQSLLAFKGRCMDVNFDIGSTNYKPLEKIGTGAYGVVCSALNKKNGDKVAIKKIPNAFDELTTAKRTFRELKILRHFRHENVIGIREILMPKEPLADMKDVYVVFDLMESDLHQIIHSNQPFSLEHIRFFLYQILRGLKYIHSADVIHRDLKPSNLLVNENCELKVGDFGMARGLCTMNKDKKRMFMTSYVATRWYRAPELLFSSDDYTLAVDIWSVGCILGEMIGRKQMFPGKNPIDQLSLIVDVLGMPPTHMLRMTNSDQLYNFFQKNFANKTAKDLHKLYPNADPQSVDLLKEMLIFEPSKRITIEKALQHPFLATYYSPDDEPDCFPKFDFSFEGHEMTREQIRQQVGKMILKYNKPKGWISKGVLSVVPKTTTAFSASEPTANHGKLQTVGPSSSQTPLQTIGPSKGRSTMQTIGPSNSGNTLQTVSPSGNRHSLQTVGPSSNRIPLQTVSHPTNRDSQATISVVRKDQEGKSVTASSGSPLIRESLLSGLTGSSLLFGGTSDTSPKFDAGDGVSQGMFKPSTDTGDKSKTDQDISNVFLGLPVLAAMSGSVSDVEMPSAKSSSGDSVASFLNSTSKTPSQGKSSNQATSLLVLSDIEMWSAKGEATPLISQPDVGDDNKVKDEGSLSLTEPTGSALLPNASKDADSNWDRSNNSSQKTISEDTKALIKAALLNSALKNQKKDRIESTSSEPGKGGGKMPVTALSRQREREEKRKQKQRRSMKKKKARQKEDNKISTVFLTEEDKNMLQRWNRMQQTLAANNGRDGEVVAPVQSGSPAMPDRTCHPPNDGSTQPETVHTTDFKATDKTGNSGRKNIRSPVILAESPKFEATTDIIDSSFFEQISPLSQGSYPQSPDFLSHLDLPSGNSLFSSVTPFSLGVRGAGEEGVSMQDGGAIPMRNTNSQDGLVFGSTLPTTTPQVMPFMPMFVSTSRNRSDSDVFLSPQSPKQQLLYRSPADRQTPSPPTHIPSPPSCLQQSPPDYGATRNNARPNHVGSLLVNTGPAGMAASHDHTLTRRQHDSTSSDISTIIRQLSRSMVEDPLPSFLTVPLPVTPKGDGGGYGLSLDLEELMGETLGPDTVNDVSNKCDSAPLSASLLSDWLDVRHLNSEDMKAIELDIHNLTSENLRDIQRELGLTSPVGIPVIPALDPSRTDKSSK